MTGADADLTDTYGLTAWQNALQRSLTSKVYAADIFPALHEMLAPGSVDLMADNRLIKLDSALGEFMLFNVLLVFFRLAFNESSLSALLYTATSIEELTANFSNAIIPGYRKKSVYISSLLAKNEAGSSHPYGRMLFKRKAYWALHAKR